MCACTVVGCATPPIGRAQWLQRSGNQLVIGCNASRQQWQMTCQDGNWLGTLGNCTNQQTGNNSDASTLSTNPVYFAYTNSLCIIVPMFSFFQRNISMTGASTEFLKIKTIFPSVRPQC